MRQLRKRSQLCKRCVASTRRRSFLDSRRRFVLRRENFCDEFFEARVAAKLIKHWIDLNRQDIGPGAFAVGSFHLVNRTLFVAEGQVYQCETIGMDVARLSLFA